ncbi:Hypothetical_protein [Hexamita inflata]|uniref:Hypothetical_protein n=1 Tax=Hexamita inflata TaxID=28002 RepID=A0AA86QJ26_9EUKA|nr:Hypothetical protein HINF_LOCUS43133 [Hexamita inflata]
MCRIYNNKTTHDTPAYFAHIPFSVFLVFDLIPFPKFTPFWQKIVNEMSRLQMQIFLVHHPFLKEAGPRNFPYISAINQLIQENHTWINMFSSWIYLLIFGMLSYPLWFMQRPLEVMPVWIKSVADKSYKKDKQFKQNIVLSFVGIIMGIILIAVAQSDVYGHDFVPAPPLWKDFQK